MYLTPFSTPFSFPFFAIAHRANMLGVYVGGVLIAGAFALMPGRLLHGWLFG